MTNGWQTQRKLESLGCRCSFVVLRQVLIVWLLCHLLLCVYVSGLLTRQTPRRQLAQTGANYLVPESQFSEQPIRNFGTIYLECFTLIFVVFHTDTFLSTGPLLDNFIIIQILPVSKLKNDVAWPLPFTCFLLRCKRYHRWCWILVYFNIISNEKNHGMVIKLVFTCYSCREVI